MDEVSTAPRMGEMGWDGMADRRGPRDPPLPGFNNQAGAQLDRSWSTAGMATEKGESSWAQPTGRVELQSSPRLSRGSERDAGVRACQ